MRSALALGAAAVAALAAVIAQLDGDDDIVPFFVALTVAALIAAWLLTDPGRPGRLVARGIAVLWLGAATWIGGLLVFSQVTCGCSMPEPVAPEATYLWLPATVYHLAGVYLGGAFMAVAAFSRRL